MALNIGDEDFKQAGERLTASKTLSRADISLTSETNNKQGREAYAQALCETVLDAHDTSEQTLVVVNRVERAQALYRLLKQQRTDQPDC